MSDLKELADLIKARINEIDARLNDIEDELDQPKTRDLNDQAIDLEDDEVLESLGTAGQQERALLVAALMRIEDGSYGVCQKCGDEISHERLLAVPQAVLCRNCMPKPAT